MCFIDSLRLGFSAMNISAIQSTFLADPFARWFPNSNCLIRFSKPFVIAANPRLKEFVLGVFVIYLTKFPFIQFPLGVASAREEGIVLGCGLTHHFPEQRYRWLLDLNFVLPLYCAISNSLSRYPARSQ
jgi:hypothetical protein